MTVDFSKIVKRLELIKSLIALEEEKDIAEQIVKLKTAEKSLEIEEIILNLKEKSYCKAINNIDKFIKTNNQVIFFIDPEIEALRFEAKSLERKFQKLSDEKAEIDKLIHEFNVRHNEELGELLLNILKFRKEKNRNTPQYTESQKDYEDYHNNYKSTKNDKVKRLSEIELKELKEKYRKASKLCHPDVVEESFKIAAHKIFTELNEAYENNDLTRVSEMLENLKKGGTFTSKADTANEKLSLTQEIERIRRRIVDLGKLIIRIKNSDTFERIPSIKDWDLYFSEKKEQLRTQLEIFKNGGK